MAGLNIGLTALAAVLAVGGLLALWWRTRMGGEIALMAPTATSKTADVAKLAPGALVEIKGTLRCAQPLTAEFSNQACVYFRAEIECDEVCTTPIPRASSAATQDHAAFLHPLCALRDRG
jgi:hypothetical protein